MDLPVSASRIDAHILKHLKWIYVADHVLHGRRKWLDLATSMNSEMVDEGSGHC